MAWLGAINYNYTSPDSDQIHIDELLFVKCIAELYKLH